jgi:hypothetical protein
VGEQRRRRRTYVGTEGAVGGRSLPALIQAGSAPRVHDCFQQAPFLTSGQLAERTGLTAPTVNAALTDLERLGIFGEITGRKQGRVYHYARYVDILSEGTEPVG